MFSQTHLYKYNVHIWLNMYYIYICLGTCYPIGWSRLVTSNRPCEQAASLEQAKLPATSPTSFPGCMLAPQVELKGSGTPVANSRLYQPKQPSVNFQSGKSHIFQNNLGHWVIRSHFGLLFSYPTAAIQVLGFLQHFPHLRTFFFATFGVFGPGLQNHCAALDWCRQDFFFGMGGPIPKQNPHHSGVWVA